MKLLLIEDNAPLAHWLSEALRRAQEEWQQAGQIRLAKAMEGEGLQWVLSIGEMLSKRGGYNPLLMRAMQILMPLSCDIDADGNVVWKEGTGGQFLVNPEGAVRLGSWGSVVVAGLTLDQAVEKMRGLVNTPITLTILRKEADGNWRLARDANLLTVQE